MVGDALSGLGADSRETAQRLDQFFQSGGDFIAFVRTQASSLRQTETACHSRHLLLDRRVDFARGTSLTAAATRSSSMSLSSASKDGSMATR